MDHAREILENYPELLQAAISSLLMGVTHFFRDVSVFDALRTRVLPCLTGSFLFPPPCHDPSRLFVGVFS